MTTPLLMNLGFAMGDGGGAGAGDEGGYPLWQGGVVRHVFEIVLMVWEGMSHV